LASQKNSAPWNLLLHFTSTCHIGMIAASYYRGQSVTGVTEVCVFPQPLSSCTWNWSTASFHILLNSLFTNHGIFHWCSVCF